MNNTAPKVNTFVKGAAIMAAATIVVRIIGAFFKIPLFSIFRQYDIPEATTYFTSAYNIFALLLLVGTTGLPIAVSKMTSAAHTTGNYKDVMTIFSVARTVFTIIGGVSSLLLFIFAPTVAVWIEGSPDAIRAISPAIFFVCLMSPYRGIHQGHSNMAPTAISQFVEALGKLVFGLLLVFAVVRAAEYAVNPYDAAAAGILGVTIGSTLGVAFLLISWQFYKKRYTDRVLPVQLRRPKKDVFRELMRLAIPVTLAAVILQLANIVDMSVALRRLIDTYDISKDAANAMFAPIAEAAPITGFPQGLVIAMSVSIVPTLSAAIAARNRKDVYAVVDSALNITALLALPAVLGLFALGTPIMHLLFGSGTRGGVILSLAALNIIPLCMTTMSNAMLQSMGKPTIPMINMILGSIVRVIATWFLMTWIGLYGAVVSSFICYSLIVALNMRGIAVVVPARRLLRPFIRPAIAAFIMSAVVYFANRGLMTILPGGLDNSLATLIGVVLSIGLGVVIYGWLAISLGMIRKQDMQRIPKIGKRLAEKFNMTNEPKPVRALKPLTVLAVISGALMLIGMATFAPLYTQIENDGSPPIVETQTQSLAMGDGFLVAVAEDGTLLVAGENAPNVDNFYDVVSVFAWENHITVLHTDGTVSFTLNTPVFTDEEMLLLLHGEAAILPGRTIYRHSPDVLHQYLSVQRDNDVTAFLLPEGRIMFTGYGAERFESIQTWDNIVSFAMGHGVIAVLRADGSVVADGCPMISMQVGAWKGRVRQ